MEVEDLYDGKRKWKKGTEDPDWAPDARQRVVLSKPAPAAAAPEKTFDPDTVDETEAQCLRDISDWERLLEPFEESQILDETVEVADLPSRTRLLMIKALIDYHMYVNPSDAHRDLVRDLDQESLMEEELGYDAKGRRYFYFSQFYRDCIIFRETFHKRTVKYAKTIMGGRLRPARWETLCTDLAGLSGLISELKKDKKKNADLIEGLDSVKEHMLEEAEKIKQEKKRMEKLAVLAAMPKKRSSRIARVSAEKAERDLQMKREAEERRAREIERKMQAKKDRERRKQERIEAELLAEKQKAEMEKKFKEEQERAERLRRKTLNERRERYDKARRMWQMHQRENRRLKAAAEKESERRLKVYEEDTRQHRFTLVSLKKDGASAEVIAQCMEQKPLRENYAIEEPIQSLKLVELPPPVMETDPPKPKRKPRAKFQPVLNDVAAIGDLGALDSSSPAPATSTPHFTHIFSNASKSKWRGEKTFDGIKYQTDGFVPSPLEAARSLDALLKSYGFSGQDLPNQMLLAKYEHQDASTVVIMPSEMPQKSPVGRPPAIRSPGARSPAAKSPVAKSPAAKGNGAYPKSRFAPSITLKDMIDRGVLVPGPHIEFKTKVQTFHATLRPDGKIEFQGRVFKSCSSFGLVAKRIVAPECKSINGWASVSYKGIALQKYRNPLLDPSDVPRHLQKRPGKAKVAKPKAKPKGKKRGRKSKAEKAALAAAARAARPKSGRGRGRPRKNRGGSVADVIEDLITEVVRQNSSRRVLVRVAMPIARRKRKPRRSPNRMSPVPAHHRLSPHSTKSAVFSHVYLNPTKTRWKGEKSIRGVKYSTNAYFATAQEAAFRLDLILKSAGVPAPFLPNQEALANCNAAGVQAAPEVPADVRGALGSVLDLVEQRAH